MSRLSGTALCLCLVGALSPSSGQVLIQELLYDGPGADSDDVFTELTGPPGTSLDGWSLVGVNGDGGGVYRTVDLSGVAIPADGILVVAHESAAGSLLAARDLVGLVDWQNGPDAVQLLDDAGNLIDALQYGDAGPFNAGEGNPAPAPPPGASLARNAAGTDSDDNAADFGVVERPTPGAVEAGGITLSLPDLLVAPGDTAQVDLHLSGLAGEQIVSFEAFVTYDRRVAGFAGAESGSAITGPEWALVAHVAAGETSTVDTVKVAAATGGGPLHDDGPLVRLRLALPGHRVPATTVLAVEHVLLDDGLLPVLGTAGSLAVAGADGAIAAGAPVAPPDTVGIAISDVDADRTEAVDAVPVRVSDGADSELLEALETGVTTGEFTLAVAVDIGAPVPGNGRIETIPGHRLAVCYIDSLDAAGATSERCVGIAVIAGSDGRVQVTQVSQPGDTLRVRVVDADLNRDPQRVESARVELACPEVGDRELVTVHELSADDSTFAGVIITAVGVSEAEDGVLATGGAERIAARYFDAFRAVGDTATVVMAGAVIDRFGDADGNGLVQAFDAARVLAHVLEPFLTGPDSLAANVDSLAPDGAITPYDASLILQHRVGVRRLFPVQSRGAHNQPGQGAPAVKVVADERLLTLDHSAGHVALSLDDGAGILSGTIELPGTVERVAVGQRLAGFTMLHGAAGGRTRVVFAGAKPATGGGELLRLYGIGRLDGVRARFNDGRITAATAAVTAVVERRPALPAHPVLHPNYPNPFNAGTVIPFDLALPGWVELAIFDLLGQQVRTLLDADLCAGSHRIRWDGRDDGAAPVATGVYLYQLRAGGLRQVGRMLLLR